MQSVIVAQGPESDIRHRFQQLLVITAAGDAGEEAEAEAIDFEVSWATYLHTISGSENLQMITDGRTSATLSFPP